MLHIAAENGHLPLVKKLSSVYNSEMVSMPNDEILSATGLAIKVSQTTRSCFLKQKLLNHKVKKKLIVINMI